jgi:hypothetical protein
MTRRCLVTQTVAHNTFLRALNEKARKSKSMIKLLILTILGAAALGSLRAADNQNTKISFVMPHHPGEQLAFVMPHHPGEQLAFVMPHHPGEQLAFVMPHHPGEILS